MTDVSAAKSTRNGPSVWFCVFVTCGIHMNNNLLNYFVCHCEQTGRVERYIEDVIAAEVKICAILPPV